MTYDNEVIKEAESIMTKAMESMADERKREHIHSLPLITKGFLELIKESREESQTVHLGYIQPDETLDLSAQILSCEPVSIDMITNSPSDYTSAKSYLFYSFDDMKEAMNCLQQPIAAILAHELNRAETAIYMYLERKKYGIAVLVAAECLTVSRIVSGETTTEHISLNGKDITDETPDKFFASCGLSDKESNLVRALIEFHTKPAVLKREFPNAYEVSLEKIKEQMMGNDDSDGE